MAVSMLRVVHIERFKCFESYRLDLSALTLLTGYNGAGKSSSLQPLLLLAQALRERPCSNVLAMNGPLVRLGSAGDVVSESAGGPITLGFSSEADHSAFWVFANDRALQRGELSLDHSHFSFDEGDAPRWSPDGDLHPLLASVRDLIFIGASRRVSGEAQPFPESPTAVVGDVGAEGQWAGYWYIRQADEEVPTERRHPDDPRVTVRAQVDAWLNFLFPGAGVNAEQLPGVALSRTSYTLGRSNERRRPSNVGYGLSYAFPLLVALICAAPGQVVIVDSPEAHLHPRAQSSMGRLLAHFAAAGVQVIVESHSDHLLSGVRLAVREGLLPAQKSTIHFFGADDGAVGNPQRIAIGGDGSISDWPEGFFDQALTDLIGLS